MTWAEILRSWILEIHSYPTQIGRYGLAHIFFWIVIKPKSPFFIKVTWPIFHINNCMVCSSEPFFLNCHRAERVAVRVLKSISIQIFARFYPVVDRCSFLDSKKISDLETLRSAVFYLKYGGQSWKFWKQMDLPMPRSAKL